MEVRHVIGEIIKHRLTDERIMVMEDLGNGYIVKLMNYAEIKVYDFEVEEL